MSILKDFKTFALKGNVIDMAVGIIIGVAFGKIVSSLVNDIIMPPIGVLIGGVDFSDLKMILKEKQLDESGKVIFEAVTLNYGNFIQTTVDFLIIAFAVFSLIRTLMYLKKKEEEKPEPVTVSNQEKLLMEIRDELKKK